MKLSIADQRIWALGLTLAIIVVAGMCLLPSAGSRSMSASAAPQGGLTELVLGGVTLLLGAAAS